MKLSLILLSFHCSLNTLIEFGGEFAEHTQMLTLAILSLLHFQMLRKKVANRPAVLGKGRRKCSQA